MNGQDNEGRIETTQQEIHKHDESTVLFYKKTIADIIRKEISKESKQKTTMISTSF